MEEAYQFLVTQIKKENKPIVAGISGGPDSMALLHLLLRLRKEMGTIIVCAHVNHNVREVSEQEAIDLKRYCDANHIPFELMKIEDYGTDNFENEARIKRYIFFEELISKYNAKYLVTAHHGDDLMETILMRIVRGSTFKGYAGFSRIVNRGAYTILRPFITVTKEDLVKYDEKNNLSYAVDMTNFSDEHTRNRYRKYVLPFLKTEDAKVHQKFWKFSETMLEYSEYIDNEMQKVINDVYNQDQLNINQFLKLDKVMQNRIINHIMETIYLDDLLLVNDNHTAMIIKLINSSKPNLYILLPNSVKVVKAYDTLSFLKNDEQKENYKIEFSSFVNLPNGKILEIINDNEEKSNFVCRLNSADLKLPLYVRNKRKGDRMEIKGMTGRKKIKDIFINEKIKMNDRETWPILVDGDDNIIWLPGLKKSKYDKSKNERYDIIIRYY